MSKMLWLKEEEYDDEQSMCFGIDNLASVMRKYRLASVMHTNNEFDHICGTDILHLHYIQANG